VPITQSTGRRRRSPITTSNDVPYEANATCPRSRSEVKIYGQPVQNDYCYDNSCDTNKWAMIPVKIISVRPPKFTKYQSYPVHHGRVNTTEDIYSPSANNQTNRSVRISILINTLFIYNNSWQLNVKNESFKWLLGLVGRERLISPLKDVVSLLKASKSGRL
jgi:hypothetical protein